MSDTWQQWLVMWELIGELENWRINDSRTSYTFEYCDECGACGCVSVECHASRRGFFDDLSDYIANWRG